MRTTTTTVAVLLLCASSACSSNDRADTIITTTLPAPETTAPTPAPSTTPPTTAPPTSPPTVPVTPPATTQPTAPPTSPPTTTPLDPIADLTAAIQRDAQAAEDALTQAAAAPGSPDAAVLADRHFAGESHDNVVGLLGFLVNNEMIGMPNPDVPSIIRLTSVASLINGRSDLAEASTCRIDAGMIVDPLGEPGGPYAIYNDDITRTLALTQFLLVDGVWQLNGGNVIEETSGATSCDG